MEPKRETAGTIRPMKAKKELAVITPKPANVATLSNYLELLGHDIPDNIRAQFLEICGVFGLNPFLREIYLVGYMNKNQSGPPTKKFNIIVGFEVYLKRAERSGRLNGWKSGTTLQDGELFGYVEIFRKDWDKPFYLQVRMNEYKQPNKMWKTKPHTMIEKVAISQGFRRCFPNELAGIPYTSEELSHAEPLKQAPTPGNNEIQQPPKQQARESQRVVDVKPEPIPDKPGKAETIKKKDGDEGPPKRGDFIQMLNLCKSLESLRVFYRETRPVYLQLYAVDSEDYKIIEKVLEQKSDALKKKENKGQI